MDGSAMSTPARTFYFTPDLDPATELDDGEQLTEVMLTTGVDDAVELLDRLSKAIIAASRTGDSVQVDLGPGRGDWRVFIKGEDGEEDDPTAEELARAEGAPLRDAAAAWAALPSESRQRALDVASEAARLSERWAAKLRAAGEQPRAQRFDDDAVALTALLALGKAAMRAPCTPCAAVAYVFRDGRVLSVTRKDTGQHSAPGGKVMPGEAPKEAMRRELEEETGLVARSSTLVYEAEGPSGRYVYAYLVEVDPSAEPVAVEPGTTVAWVAPAELAASFAPEFHGPGVAAALRALGKAAAR